MADCKKYSRVPSEYQELTNIANSGTQYIDTGLKGSDLVDCELEIVMRNDTGITTSYNFNGTYLSGSTAQFGLVATSSSECRSSINFGFADAISTTGLSLYEFHTLYATNGLQKVDNTVVGTSNFGTLNDSNFLLFARTDPNQTSGVNICPAMGLKSFTVKRNNQYIRNMIPVRRKSDSQLGLYDLTYNVFYTNQGTGSFMAGSDVNNWLHSLRKLTTATDTFTTLPADIYADGNNATVGISGNTVQSGTPTPDNPIMPQGCGDLETVGTKAGQYKIPISSGNTTTPVYLGEVETTRKIKKLVLTGNEEWYGSAKYRMDLFGQIGTVSPFCTHYIGVTYTGYAYLQNGQISVNGETARTLCICDTTNQTSIADWKSYLAQQYAAGTPVTVWYVLANEETGVVNEPLMKISNYADTVSGITIPTITGADSFDVQTTLKPSEVSLSYTGWHDASVKEWDGSQWD